MMTTCLKRSRFFKLGSLLAVSAAIFSAPLHAEDGVTEKEIKIGMVNALSGAAAGLGTNIKAGAEAYIARINAVGGVNGRKITLVSLDDKYEPEAAAAATKKLIEEEKVFALFGYVGTPTSATAVPIASKAGVPYLFPFTGAEFLRNPVNPMVFNLRASYYDETETMVERLTKDLDVKKIAIFIQDDAFGEAGKAGVLRALQKRNLKLAEEARYKRNTMDVDAGLAKIKAAQPEAVVFVGTYSPFASIVKKAKASGIHARFLTVSFIGTADFIKEAGTDGDGVYITQVMPSPEDRSTTVVNLYNSDMKGNNVNYTSLEGYVNAVVMVDALRKTGLNPTREGLIASLDAMKSEMLGWPISFSATKHQGSDKVFLTQVKGGKAVPVNSIK